MPFSSFFAPTLVAALSALSFAAVAGCSSDNGGSSTTTTTTSSSSGGDGGSSSTSSTTSGGGGTGGGTPIECDPPANHGPMVDVTLTSAEATVVDVNDAPVANSAIQLCGLNICLYGTTGADGHVKITADNKKLTTPAFKYGDGFSTGKFAVPIKDAVTTLGTVVTAQLPATGESLAPGTAVKSGPVTLLIPDGAGVNIDVLTYDTPDKQVFKAASVPVAKALPAVDPSLSLEMIFVVAPVDTVFCPAVGVTVDNTEGWAAGTAVEFFVHGVGIEEYYVPYGGWAKISEGAVSADGKTISTAADGGLPILSAFGIRQKK